MNEGGNPKGKAKGGKMKGTLQKLEIFYPLLTELDNINNYILNTKKIYLLKYIYNI